MFEDLQHQREIYFVQGLVPKTNKQTTKTTKPNKETVEPDALYLSLCNKGGHFEGCK